jgi:uncharacterized membrane protein YdjX (TVP38/TMEM64 family)
MNDSDQFEKKKRLRQIAAGLLPAIALIGLIALWYSGVLRDLYDKDRLIAVLRDGGVKGPLVCIAAQFIQVVIFIIPGEITQVAAGYVFGAWRGLLYSVAGILFGSAFNFYLARVVGRPTLEAFISPSTFEKIDKTLAKPKAKSAMFFLFLLPGAPKDALCYAAGLSQMGIVEFLVISGLGRLPALFASILIGSRAYQRDYVSLILIVVLLALTVAGYYLYERARNRRELVGSGQP